MKKVITFFFFIVYSSSAFAQTVTYDRFCNLRGLFQPLRQTIVVVDGILVTPEADGQRNDDNFNWRSPLAKLLDATDPSLEQRFAARELITLVVTNPDGSGFSRFFRGCIPAYSKEEQDKYKSEETLLDYWLGRGWQQELEDAQEEFRRSLARSLVEPASQSYSKSSSQASFFESNFLKSLGKGEILSLADGAPRIIVFTDLSLYRQSPIDVISAKKNARKAADSIKLNLYRSEIFIFGAHGSFQTEAIESFFLSSAGKVVSVASTGAALNALDPPVKVDIYQGSIEYPDDSYPIRMRLALDRNDTAVNAWIELQTDRKSATPIGGILKCSDVSNCEFIGDNVFSQIWSDDPSPEPECLGWMPFGGLRNLEFKIVDDTIEGRVQDPICEVLGMPNGLPLTMVRIKDGIF